MKYADDNKSYSCYSNSGDIISCLERTAADLFRWFSNNGMKANADKCHLLQTKEKPKANISVAMCRGDLSAVIIRLMSKCL